MTPFDAATLNRLAKKIAAANETHTAHVRSGSAQNFADYQNRAGYLRALDDVCEWMRQVESDLRQGK